LTSWQDQGADEDRPGERPPSWADELDLAYTSLGGEIPAGVPEHAAAQHREQAAALARLRAAREAAPEGTTHSIARLANAMRRRRSGASSEADDTYLTRLKELMRQGNLDRRFQQILSGVDDDEADRENDPITRAASMDLGRERAEFRKQEAARRKSGPATDKKSQPGGQ
jgi:hypothetical protein